MKKSVFIAGEKSVKVKQAVGAAAVLETESDSARLCNLTPFFFSSSSVLLDIRELAPELLWLSFLF